MGKPQDNPYPPDPIRVYRAQGTNICVVDAGSIHIGKKTEVSWKNETGDDIEIFVPQRRLNGNKTYLKIGDSDSKNIVFKPATSGEEAFKYVVYCHATGNFAVAGSEPEMIVP